MPPKKGKKRKAIAATNGNDDHANDVAVPDRQTWPGWVEMESEPAFFNVMLREMGVRGAKVQEVYALDEEMLAVLPRPIHALIFLFKYKETESEQPETSCPKHIWFANQVPDFACATIALLNIVNNIQGLEVGKEIREFKTLTANMSPLQRGEAIDEFTFVKRIHNSFARDTDILNADMYLKEKAAKAKKRAAAKKASAMRKAKLEEAKSKVSISRSGPVANGVPTSATQKPPSPPDSRASSRAGAKRPPKTSTRSSAKRTLSAAAAEDDAKFVDGDYNSSSLTSAKDREIDKPVAGGDGLRRSSRKPKPRKQDNYVVDTQDDVNPEEEGFHFIAYMPIGDHVWKLDGMDSFPQDLGTFSTDFGDSWLSIAQPALQARMLQYEASEIQFNLMAVCHDALVDDTAALVSNVNALQSIDAKLDEVYDDWRAMDGAETATDVLTGAHEDYDITDMDVNVAKEESIWSEKIATESDLLKLIELRKEIISAQSMLRASVRDGLLTRNDDNEKARQRRHDYAGFVKGWLSALAENELLTPLLED